jgi:aspartate 1-decarboxylase
VGDCIIICAYVGLDAAEAARFKPKLVYLDAQNYVTHTRNTIPVQLATA